MFCKYQETQSSIIKNLIATTSKPLSDKFFDDIDLFNFALISETSIAYALSLDKFWTAYGRAIDRKVNPWLIHFT